MAAVPQPGKEAQTQGGASRGRGCFGNTPAQGARVQRRQGVEVAMAWLLPRALLALAMRPVAPEAFVPAWRGIPCSSAVPFAPPQLRARGLRVPRRERAPRSRVVMLSESPLPGNPNAGGAGFKLLSGKKRVIDPVKRDQDWQAWLDSLTPEERETVEENERLSPLNRHLFNVTQRMQETGCGEFDAEGKFVEGSAGRTTVWDKDIDGRWMLHQVSVCARTCHRSHTCGFDGAETCPSRLRAGHGGRESEWDAARLTVTTTMQCPTSELPANILRRDRFLHEHPGWFRDRCLEPEALNPKP